MSLRTRIAAIAGLAVAVTVIAATVTIYLAVRSNLRGEVEQALEQRAEPLVAGGPRGPGGGPAFGPPPMGERFGPPPADERPALPPEGARPGPPPRGEPLGQGERPAVPPESARPGPPPRGKPLGQGERPGPPPSEDPVPPPRVERLGPLSEDEPLGPPPERFGPPPRSERFGGAEGYVQLVSPRGVVDRPPESTTALPVSAIARRLARRGEGRSLDEVTVDGVHVLVLSSGIGDRGAVQVARPLTETDAVLDRVLVLLLAVGVIGIALAAVLGALVARTALAPIARFTRRTEALADTPDISERMEVSGGGGGGGGKDELARLARSFNTTLDALERAVEAQRQLVADASHELRTPIASIRANIQTLEFADELPEEELAALRADILSELDELTALVGDVVELARGTNQAEGLDDVRLDTIVDSLVRRAQRRGEDVGYSASLEPTLIRGEPERISRAVTNLLDNARKWSPPGATIDVELRDGTITVRDRGPGFAEADLPHVFERFYRSEAARGMPGSGLGLAIVRQAAEAHGGRAQAANALDGGAVLSVRFGDPVEVAQDLSPLSSAPLT